MTEYSYNLIMFYVIIVVRPRSPLFSARTEGMTGSASLASAALTPSAQWPPSDASRRPRVVLKNLYPPQLFGEASVLNPRLGREAGAVVAVTLVELLLVHKNQIKPEWITEEIEATLRGKAIQWPVGSEVKHLYVMLFWTALWKDGVGGGGRSAHSRSLYSLSFFRSPPLHSPFSSSLALSLFSGAGINQRSSGRRCEKMCDVV